MITINLVPDSYKSARKNSQGTPVTLILLIVNALFLGIFLIVTSLNVYKTVTLKAITTRLSNLEQKKNELVALQHKITNLNGSNSIIEAAVFSDFCWSRILNNLNDAIIPGVWLKQISIHKKTKKTTIDYVEQLVENKFLKIEGTVVSLAHDEMAVVSSFVRGLKKNNNFSALFKKLELESVLRRKIATVEVMDFTLLCHFGEKVI